MLVRMLFETGYEEVEALTVIDLMRRAGIDCSMVAADDKEFVTSARGICVKMDEKISEIENEADMIVLPGGMPGVPNLIANKKVENLVKRQYEAGRYVAAICAGPTVLGAFGVLKEEEAICYPGMEDKLCCKKVVMNKVVVSNKVITSRGLGTALDFGFTLIEILKGKAVADEIASKIVYTYDSVIE